MVNDLTRVDGVSQEDLKPHAFDPQGVLAHEYFPIEHVIITDDDHDVSYIASYWNIDSIWQAFIKDRNVYERLRNKLLEGRKVIVDYRDLKNLGLYIPTSKPVDGLHELYTEVLDDLRAMDREDLDRHMEHIGYNRISASDYLREKRGED